MVRVGDTGAAINTDDLGLFKREEWKFQHESRFKIIVQPFCPLFAKLGRDSTHNLLNLMSAIGPSLGINYPIKTKYIDISIKPEVLNKIEVMLGPQTSLGEKTIVKILLKEYPQSAILNSYFDGKIRK